MLVILDEMDDSCLLMSFIDIIWCYDDLMWNNSFLIYRTLPQCWNFFSPDWPDLKVHDFLFVIFFLLSGFGFQFLVQVLWSDFFFLLLSLNNIVREAECYLMGTFPKMQLNDFHQSFIVHFAKHMFIIPTVTCFLCESHGDMISSTELTFKEVR